MKKFHQASEKGFTIIELMIATAVLSTILLLVTVLMINIGNLYYKGINQARVQDNVRSITDEVVQHLQLGDTLVPADTDHHGPNGEHAYCIGSTRYTYFIGTQIDQPAPGSSAPVFQHVLWRDDNPDPASCDATGVNLTDSSPTTGRHGAELIAPRSRLMQFAIDGTSPYNISIGVAYGDDDLLCSPVVTDSCKRNAPPMTQFSDFAHGSLLCKDSDASQFCSTAGLDTTVVRRLP